MTYDWTAAMARKGNRQTAMRTRIAAAAARIMAEDGVDDFALAKRKAARQLAAQGKAQLEVGAPAALSFEPVTLPELRRRWLEHHEQGLRSSVQTVNRYRTATDHLLRFLDQHLHGDVEADHRDQHAAVAALRRTPRAPRIESTEY